MTALLKRMLASRRRISTQLYLGVGSAVVLTITASLVGWFSFNRVGSTQRQLNEESVPGMAAAFEIAQQSGALVAAAPLLVAATTPEEFDRIAAGVDQASDAFEVQLEVLEQQGDDEERFNRIHDQGKVLIANIKTIEDLVEERFTLHDRLEVLRAELEALQSRLIINLTPAIDDQLFYLVTGYRNLGEAPAPLEQHLSEEEVNRYRYLTDLQADASSCNPASGEFIRPLGHPSLRTATGALRSHSQRDQGGPIGPRNGFSAQRGGPGLYQAVRTGSRCPATPVAPTTAWKEHLSIGRARRVRST